VGIALISKKCPICGRSVDLPDDVLPGEVVDHDCGVSLEVILNNGEILLKPLEISEDWGE